VIRLLRHGETAFNAEGRFLGATDLPLSERGRSQAVALRPHLEAFAPDALASSPLRRARETLALALPDARGAEVDDRLREVDWGEWEGLTLEEIRSRYPDLAHSYLAGEVRSWPGGESPADAADRMLRSLRSYAGARVLVVSHSTCVRVALSALLGLDPRGYRKRLGGLAPAAWVDVRLTPDGYGELLAYNLAPPTPSG
jgi:broad specificity phosphatase PhoE